MFLWRVSGNISRLFSKPISSCRLVFSAENDLCNINVSFGFGICIHLCYLEPGEKHKLKCLADAKGDYALVLGDCSNLMLYL